MRSNKLLILAAAMVAVAVPVAKGDDAQLDRGHLILRERGLQIAGWVFPYTYNHPNGPHGLNLDLFANSRLGIHCSGWSGTLSRATQGRTGDPRCHLFRCCGKMILPPIPRPPY